VAGFEDYIIGLTEHNGTMYAVSRYSVQSYNGTVSNLAGGYAFTGAVAGWTNGSSHLLLLGLQRSIGSFGYGYREILIDGGASDASISVPGMGIRGPLTPPDAPDSDLLSSVEVGSQYISAIGKYPVNYLYAMSPFFGSGDNKNRPIIFASTAMNGLWSYRVRGGDAQWNGEDNGR
jgi:hypothetical protein